MQERTDDTTVTIVFRLDSYMVRSVSMKPQMMLSTNIFWSSCGKLRMNWKAKRDRLSTILKKDRQWSEYLRRFTVIRLSDDKYTELSMSVMNA